jgi:hypothetical protein
MTLTQIPPLAADTARAAELAFGRDHLCLRLGRELENLLADFALPQLPCDDGSRARGFWPYSLASILQFWEDLTDRQMSSATRTRLDLKYALHLSLDFPGFEPQALCSFRCCMLSDSTGKAAFQDMVAHLKDFAADPVKRQADADGIIAILCLLSRAELILETMANTLEAVAAYCPDWLITSARPHWYARYGRNHGPHHIPREPEKTRGLLQAVGEDGQYLMQAIGKAERPGLKTLPEVLLLGQEWGRQFSWQEGEPKLRESCSSLCGVNTVIIPNQ